VDHIMAGLPTSSSRGDEAKTVAGEKVGKSQPARLKRGPVKKPQRAIEKVIRSYRRDTARLTDLVRCTCVVEDEMQLLKLVQIILGMSVYGLVGACVEDRTRGLEVAQDKGDAMFRLLKIENRFDENYDADVLSAGYRDVSMNVEVGWQMEDGLVVFKPVREWGKMRRHICELQVHLRGFNITASEQHHQNYVEWRDMLTR